jgi:flagellar biosynthesis protein FlhG
MVSANLANHCWSTRPLAEAGESVVIVDENPGPDNAHRVFGLKARHDLLDLVQSDLPMQRIVQPVAARLSLLSAAEFVVAQPQIDTATATHLNSAFRQLQEGSSYVLIDCAAGKGQHLSPLALAAPQMAVVVAAQGTAITKAYALVKRLVLERGREGFQVAITRAGSDREALSIFHNMRQTAHEHLGVRLDYLGSARVPSVDHLADALQGSLSQSTGAGDWFGFLPASRGNVMPSPAGVRLSRSS